MALAKTIKFADFVVKIGEGGAPEVFVAPCAFMARSFVRNKNLQEIVIPDCSDEEKPGWIYRDPLSVSWGVTGDGVMDEGSIETWDAWFFSTATKNVEIEITTSMVAPDDTILYYGAAHLQTLTYAANRGERMTFTVDIVGSGPLTETPVPAILGETFFDGAEEADKIMRAEKERRAAKLLKPAPKTKKEAKSKEAAA